MVFRFGDVTVTETVPGCQVYWVGLTFFCLPWVVGQTFLSALGRRPESLCQEMLLRTDKHVDPRRLTSSPIGSSPALNSRRLPSARFANDLPTARDLQPGD